MSAFILYSEKIKDLVGSDKSWCKYYFYSLKRGEVDRINPCLDYMEGSLIELGDLLILMEKGKEGPLVWAIGRATSDYEHVTYEEHKGHVLDMHFDFIIGEHQDHTGFSILLNEAGIDVCKMGKQEIKLSDELAEKLIKRFASVYMTYPEFGSGFAFNPKRDKKQVLCNYLNDYCPEFRSEVINRFSLEYKNYRQGEVVDKTLVDLTYDKTVTDFPRLCYDSNRLFDIVRPRA